MVWWKCSALGHSLGARQRLFRPSGAGDLFLTANSILSRNYRVGLGLAQNKPLEVVLEELGEVAEGVKTTNAIVEIARKYGIYTPIASELALLLKGKSVLESMNDLIRRT